MKHLLAITFLLLSFGAFAQKGDTLIVPLGKYNFLKVGDKVYKLITTLEEIKPEPSLQVDSVSSPIYKPYWFSVPNGSHTMPAEGYTPAIYLDNLIIKQQ